MRRWPWITLGLALIISALPVTWAIVESAIKQSPTDWFAGFWLFVTLVCVLALLCLGLFESWLRGDLIRRRAP
jgi:hypothetical protein